MNENDLSDGVAGTVAVAVYRISVLRWRWVVQLRYSND